MLIFFLAIKAALPLNDHMNAITLDDAIKTDLTGWTVSEKLDGVWAIRCGERLISRQGKEIHAPVSFVQSCPQNVPGELWAGRGRFEIVLSALRTCNFSLVSFWPHCEDQLQPDRLSAYFLEVTAAGGEGVVLRDPSGEMLKIVPRQSAEAVVFESGLESSVCNFNGAKFKLNCGQWPAVGSVVTFRFSGLTGKGTPKSPAFVCVRNYE